MENWHFLTKRPGDTARNPVTGEYFDEEAIELPAQALVREAIQNSLDAHSSTDPIRVRFYVSGQAHPLTANRANSWFKDAWPHFKSPDSGLRSAQVSAQPGDCAFIVVEDFGTKGLEGDPAASDLGIGTAERNHFYAFFRAEGISENIGGRGKWGVGKTVYPRSSFINTCFGFTIRNSDRKNLLMGRTILRYHHIGQERFVPDGYWGLNDSGFVSPVAGPATLDKFRRDFCISRSNESGLSVVVPYADPELTTAAIFEAVVREYFYPIIAGRLSVDIEGPGAGEKLRTLNGNNLLASMASRGNDLSGDLSAVVKLATWAHALPESDRSTLAPRTEEQAPDWTGTALPELEAESIVARFQRGEKLAFRIPLKVPSTGGDWSTSYFDIYIQQDLAGKGYPPVFIREGIIISKAAERRVRGHKLLTLVIIDDKPLATLLANAETPAHTQWSHQTQNFRGRYLHGTAFIKFVRSAPRQLAELLSASQQQRDNLTLSEFFPRPPIQAGLDEPTKRRPNTPTGPRPPVQPQPVTVERLAGGFCVRRGNTSVPLPNGLSITVAYDRSRGNPLAKYDKADFDLELLSKNLTGVRNSRCANNQMLVQLTEEDFEIVVTGFDANRDIFVQVTADEAPGD